MTAFNSQVWCSVKDPKQSTNMSYALAGTVGRLQSGRTADQVPLQVLPVMAVSRETGLLLSSPGLPESTPRDRKEEP